MVPVTIWKSIPHQQSRFFASFDGQIQTLPYETTVTLKASGKQFQKHIPGRILIRRINEHGPSYGRHPVVGIYEGSSREDYQNRERRVAYLVAAAFHGLPYDPRNHSEVQKWRIRSIDGDLNNCCADNLEWVPSFGNAGDGVDRQERYARNRDAFAAMDLGDTMSRLFGEAA